MSSWFTVEKIDEDTYAISEYKHWEETHCYLLNGTERSLLIDTGLGVSNIKKIVEALTNKPVIVIATHVHYDHIGGHFYFNNFYTHKNEVEWINGKFPLSLEYVKKLLIKKTCKFPKDFNIDEYKIFKGKPTKVVKDKDIIDLGNRKIKIIHTPGHSPGHMCFYEENSGYLFTGDLVYMGELIMFFPSTDPVEFMNSIKKISKLPIRRILPGHHNLNIDVSIIKQIDEAFMELEEKNILRQGSGIFKYRNFSIHL